MTFEISYNWVQTTRAPPPGREPIPPLQALIDDYVRHSLEIDSRHHAQTLDDVAALRSKYATPVLGRVSPWSVVESLGRCIDPTDQRLYCASQHLHILQIIDAMEQEGAASDEMVLVALVHDLGKVLLLTDEAPENIVCMNRPIRVCAPGGGLDNCVFQWNHDEFAYSRLKDHLPDPLAWLVRYHSIVPEACELYMDARDRDYYQRYLKPFSRYDHGTKSPFYLPKRRLADYRHVVERALPASIAI
jgi:hypothetical protein